MKIIGILNELYNNNKLENKRFKTPDGTILNNTEALLDYVGVSDNEWYSLTDLIETLQSEVEVLEEVEDKKYEDIDFINMHYDNDLEEYVAETLTNNNLYKEVFNSKYDEMIINKINDLIRNQKYILEQLNKEGNNE